MIMPNMRGTELVRRIEERCGPVAALFVSGYTGEQAMEDMRLQPRQRFLQKPFAPQQLLSVIRELLDSTRAMRERGSKRA
jgi:CheY-like chemotaxis protein